MSTDSSLNFPESYKSTYGTSYAVQKEDLYFKAGVGVSTFLPTPPKTDPDSTALIHKAIPLQYKPCGSD